MAAAAAAAAAAGVVVYDFNEGDPSSIRLLLVREKLGQWSTFAGKIDSSLDASRSPAATAARELEEESHGFIPAAATQRLLQRCPQFYWSGGSMAFYMLRYRGGGELPQLMAVRLAGGFVMTICLYFEYNLTEVSGNQGWLQLACGHGGRGGWSWVWQVLSIRSHNAFQVLR
jgi:hypothetical protein